MPPIAGRAGAARTMAEGGACGEGWEKARGGDLPDGKSRTQEEDEWQSTNALLTRNNNDAKRDLSSLVGENFGGGVWKWDVRLVEME